MQVADIPGIDKLNTKEKILLVENIWENIIADETTIPVPNSHKNELDKRFNRYKLDPGRLLSLDELRGKIEARK